MFHFEQLSNRERFEVLLLVANTALALSVGLLLVSIVVCYPLADMFSFQFQLAGHIAVIISATLVKIAYVCRCISQYELKREVR